MEYEEIKLSRMERFFRCIVQHYNHEKYWKYRSIVIDPKQGSKLGDMYRLWYIKRSDAFNNASMGTHRNYGAKFATPPKLPHGLNGIVVSHNAIIGRNCRIYHQVTIGEGKGGAPTIGDDVLIGAGAKIIGNVHIGNRAKIGIGCIVMQSVPEDCIVVPEDPRFIIHSEAEHIET